MAAQVLIVDDSPQLRAEIKRALTDAEVDASFVEADNGIEALKLLAAGGCDLVLCDVQMPVMDGFQFLRMVRARPGFEATPVIMLTGRDGSEEKIFGLEVGAADYVTKPFVAGELVARVRVHLKLKALADELRAANEKLLALSVTDYLTGVFNRRHFAERLAYELQRAQRYGNALSLIILDLDHFKRINDGFGHAEGDAVLASFAAVLKQRLRSTDLVARYGGEEFVVLLPQTGLPEAAYACDKLRAHIAQIALGSRPKGSVTFSAGIASYPTLALTDPDALLARADAALYRAKENGRNRVEVAS